MTGPGVTSAVGVLVTGDSRDRWLDRAQRAAHLLNEAIEWKLEQERRADARFHNRRRQARRRRRQRIDRRRAMLSALTRRWWLVAGWWERRQRRRGHHHRG